MAREMGGAEKVKRQHDNQRLTIRERLDALLDVGRRINEGIERGQAIGGLIQGIGWVTTEELVYNERGELLSSSPTTAIPSDIGPAEKDA